MNDQSRLFPSLIIPPYPGPYLTVDWDGRRTAILKRYAAQLEDELGREHPQVALMRSWYAVSHGAECFNQGILDILCETEPVIRVAFPEATQALALNLAAQGCHTWFLHSYRKAMQPLLTAFEMVQNGGVVVDADLVKIAEVLADCFRAEREYDLAVYTLYVAQPALLGAIEQREFTVAQYEEFREEFIEAHADDCSEECQHMVEALRGPRMRASFPDLECGRVDL